MKFLSISILFGLVQCLPVENPREYEYVVIGSGPGGGTLAANLARAGHSVFLIESGEDNGDDLLQRIPAWNNPASEAPDMSWQFFVSHFKNETQARRDNKYTYRLNNGSFYVGLDPPHDAKPLGIFYPRGSTLGGSGQVNAMNFALPPDNDWKYIAELTGDPSWMPDKMRAHFTQLERNEYLPPNVPGHGYDGYISTAQNNISLVTSRHGLSKVAIEAAKLLEGVDVQNENQLDALLYRDMNRLDTNRYTKPGVYRFPSDVTKTRERSAARNFVADTLNATKAGGKPRYPLTLSTSSLATRVLFQSATKGRPAKAYAVEYMIGTALYEADRRYNESASGKTVLVKASREVIVAGGTFNTPQILKLSGIGPREELERLKIPVIVDLPAVGKYMQETYEGGVSVRANVPWDNDPYATCTLGTTPNDPCLSSWLNNRTGPYGDTGVPLALWFRSSVSESSDCDVFFFGSANVDFHGFYPGYSTTPAPNTSFFWSMVKMQPRNQAGTVTLQSKNPRHSPLVQFNYFEQGGDLDLQALAEAAELALTVFNKTGAPYTPFQIIAPTPGVEIKQAIKDNTFGHHPTSTCRMGPKGNKDYCVDSNFKVNGVDGLRVVDASVFPRSPGAFPVAPTFMISQKAFKVIVSDKSGCSKLK